MDDENTKNSGFRDGPRLYGRTEILSPEAHITRENVVKVLRRALLTHEHNAAEIDYLYQYEKGRQPIIKREKDVRAEINNRVVENHATEIVQFVSGYFMGEPVVYVRRGDDSDAEDIELLNTFMFSEDKSSQDKDLATWLAICGVGYRMVLPDSASYQESDEAPFEIDVLDPRRTFVVNHSGFGHKPLMGVMIIDRPVEGSEDPFATERVYFGYTKDHAFTVENDQLTSWKEHILGDVPIIEYRLHMNRMGAFEPAMPLLNALNNVASNRMDSIEQFVQSFMVFTNTEMTLEDFDEFKKKGALLLRNQQGLNASVELISSELNQDQTQTLVDYLYDQILTICGMPTTTKGGASTSDTGAAVILRDGWTQAEVRAKDTEGLFNSSEKRFLKIVLNIIRTFRPDFKLRVSELECKFTRRQHDALVAKTQALQTMLTCGIAPEIAIAQSGLFSDATDVAIQSAEYLKKWEYHDPLEMIAEDRYGEEAEAEKEPEKPKEPKPETD